MKHLCHAIAVLLTLGLAAAPLPAGAAEDDGPTLIRLGIINAASSATLWALPGLAQQYNFVIRPVTFQRYADARTALAAGNIDVSNIGPQDIALAVAQGAKNIIALAGTASGGNCMVVRKDDDITDWQALKGKTIGIGAGSISWLMFAASVQENHVDYGTLHTINVVGSGTTFTRALQEHQIDMMVVWQPFCAEAVVGGYGRYPTIDHRLSRAVDNLDGVLAATRGFMAQHPAALDRLMSAYVSLVTTFQADPRKWTEIYAANTGIDPALAAESVRDATLHYTFSRAQMVRMAHFLATSGVTQRDVSGELGQYIDYRPLMKATGQSEAALGGGSD